MTRKSVLCRENSRRNGPFNARRQRADKRRRADKALSEAEHRIKELNHGS